MAAFNPFGFRGAYSTSAASQANPTLLTFPWNPNFSGWTGDIAIQYLPGGVDSIASNDGYVYPGYISQTGITIPEDGFLNYPPVVGVIVGFKYTPVNNMIVPNDQWNSYVIGTELMPNTKVEVIVNTDLQARYEIQYKGQDDLKGLSQNYLFGVATIFADDTYTVNMGGGISFTFAKGRPGVGASGGGIQGTSKLYLYQPQTQTASMATVKLIRPSSAPLFIQTPNNFDSSGWYDETSPNASENENNIVSVMFNQSFMGQNWIPLLQQTAATTP